MELSNVELYGAICSKTQDALSLRLKTGTNTGKT